MGLIEANAPQEICFRDKIVKGREQRNLKRHDNRNAYAFRILKAAENLVAFHCLSIAPGMPH